MRRECPGLVDEPCTYALVPRPRTRPPRRTAHEFGDVRVGSRRDIVSSQLAHVRGQRGRGGEGGDEGGGAGDGDGRRERGRGERRGE